MLIGPYHACWVMSVSNDGKLNKIISIYTLGIPKYKDPLYGISIIGNL